MRRECHPPLGRDWRVLGQRIGCILSPVWHLFYRIPLTVCQSFLRRYVPTHYLERWQARSTPKGAWTGCWSGWRGRGSCSRGWRCLDIGAGTGVFTVPLSHCGACVVALEPAPAMLAALQKRVEAEGLLKQQKMPRFFCRKFKFSTTVRAGILKIKQNK